MATPFVQGKLRNESLSFEVRTECACCGERIGFSMKHDLSYRLDEPQSSPMIFFPIIDLTKLKASSIVDDF